MSEKSFSQLVKSDLLKVTEKGHLEMEAEAFMGFLCAGKPGAAKSTWPIFLTTSSMDYAERLAGQLRAIDLDCLAEKVKATANSLWHVYPLPGPRITFEKAIEEYASPEHQDVITSSTSLRRAALRGAFLAAGTMNDPHKAYQVEIKIRNVQTAHLLVLLLHGENIEPAMVLRGQRVVVYFKTGQSVSDFLAIIGAHNSLLRLESVRVDKGFQNSVNRVVNCDSANANRQALASARQIALIQSLLASPASVQLDPDLLAAAKVRIENPGVSIGDLGLLMVPPIGKSGMNHRLKKLEALADTLTE